jgi:hypothetical protein
MGQQRNELKSDCELEQGPSLLSWIMDISDKHKRGLFLGMFESVYDILGAIAVLISAIIISRFGFEPLWELGVTNSRVANLATSNQAGFLGACNGF